MAGAGIFRIILATALLGTTPYLASAGSNNFSDARRDAINKYNPNAAAVSQMLGGAKSLELDGRGFGLSPRHYAFCFRQYGSYRLRDNSFVDFDGTRKPCQSPFM